MTLLNLATWTLSGRFTAAAPGATEFLGDAISAYERGGGGAKEVSGVALFFGILWKLVLVVVLIWITVWLLRRVLRTGGVPVSSRGAVRVLATTHLDARHAVYLLEVGERLLVVGSGGDSLSLLAEISSAQERAAMRERLREGGETPGFGSYLSAWVSRMSGAGGARRQLDDGKDFLAGRLEGMRKLREQGRPDEERGGRRAGGGET